MIGREADVWTGPLEQGLRITIHSALNSPFSEWGNILFNTTIATAIADRLVENSQVFLLGGPSIRKPKKESVAEEE